MGFPASGRVCQKLHKRLVNAKNNAEDAAGYSWKYRSKSDESALDQHYQKILKGARGGKSCFHNGFLSEVLLIAYVKGSDGM